MLETIDLSHWNSEPDWSRVKASGIPAVFHKFSQGTSYFDPMYAPRMKGASAEGLLFGRYHFADNADVKTQVATFLKGWTPYEALALDWENNGGATMSLGQARDFVTILRDTTGVLPALYSGNAIKDAINVGGDPGILTQCRLWLAHYASKPTLPKGWDHYWLWQYTETGTVDGISGAVDRNRFDGNEKALKATWAPAPQHTSA